MSAISTKKFQKKKKIDFTRITLDKEKDTKAKEMKMVV